MTEAEKARAVAMVAKVGTWAALGETGASAVTAAEAVEMAVEVVLAAQAVDKADSVEAAVMGAGAGRPLVEAVATVSLTGQVAMEAMEGC